MLAKDAGSRSAAGQDHDWPPNAAVTVRHLLNHTSGITYGFWDRPILGKLYRDAGVSDGLMETPGTMADNVRRLAGVPLMFQPGAAWEYGLNTDVLGRVVEVASGQTLDEFFQSRIFQPLGMGDTHFVAADGKAVAAGGALRAGRVETNPPRRRAGRSPRSAHRALLGDLSAGRQEPVSVRRRRAGLDARRLRPLPANAR